MTQAAAEAHHKYQASEQCKTAEAHYRYKAGVREKERIERFAIFELFECLNASGNARKKPYSLITAVATRLRD